MTFAPLIFFSLPLTPPPPLVPPPPPAATAAVAPACRDHRGETDGQECSQPHSKLPSATRHQIVPPRSPTTRTAPLQRAKGEWKQIQLPDAPRCPIARRTLHPSGPCRKIIWRAWTNSAVWHW